jgi:hypothetical protein
MSMSEPPSLAVSFARMAEAKPVARLLSASTKMKTDSLHGVMIGDIVEGCRSYYKKGTTIRKTSLPDNDLLELENL